MYENSVKQRYATRDAFVFPPLPQNQIQRSVQSCHWTDDTDQMILIMEMLTETNNKVDICLFTKKLKNWIEHGVPELGYTQGIGVGMLTLSLIREFNFENDPVRASKIAWRGMLAPNGSLMRTSIIAYRNLPYEQTLADAVKLSVSKCLFIG